MLREEWLTRPDFAPTLPRLLRNSVASFADRTLVAGSGERATFGDIDRESARLAKALIALGVGKATRVGILMPNTIGWVTAYLAVVRIGAIAVLISTLYQRKDLGWVMRHADIHTLLLAERFLNHDYVGRLEEVAPEIVAQRAAKGPLALASLPYLRNVAVCGRAPDWAFNWDGLLRLGEADSRITDSLLGEIESLVYPADLAIMMYTSGSTADPKGILHTHGVAVRRLEILQHIRPLSRDDRTLVVGPFCWAAGYISLNRALHTGSSVICPATPKIDDVLDIVARELPTELSAQPGMIKQLREHPRLQSGEISSSVADLLDKRLHARRKDAASRGLGMTETFGQHSVESPLDFVPDDKLEAFGRRVPDWERQIRDPETGRVLGANEQGVLWLRGPNLTVGLYKKERHEVFDVDGFYNTGDLCRIDEDGYLYFDGRSTEMIKTSGANVAPREVELALEAYPEVQEASVFQLSREGYDAIVAAAVVPKPGFNVDVDSLRSRLRHDIAAFKVPKSIFVVANEDAPRTGSGKLHKPRLREMFSGPAAPA